MPDIFDQNNLVFGFCSVIPNTDICFSNTLNAKTTLTGDLYMQGYPYNLYGDVLLWKNFKRNIWK